MSEPTAEWESPLLLQDGQRNLLINLFVYKIWLFIKINPENINYNTSMSIIFDYFCMTTLYSECLSWFIQYLVILFRFSMFYFVYNTCL